MLRPRPPSVVLTPDLLKFRRTPGAILTDLRKRKAMISCRSEGPRHPRSFRSVDGSVKLISQRNEGESPSMHHQFARIEIGGDGNRWRTRTAEPNRWEGRTCQLSVVRSRDGCQAERLRQQLVRAQARGVVVDDGVDHHLVG